MVEGGGDGAPFLVACADDDLDKLNTAAEVAAYTRALTAAGTRVEPGSGPNDAVLAVGAAHPGAGRGGEGQFAGRPGGVSGVRGGVGGGSGSSGGGCTARGGVRLGRGVCL